MKKTFLLLLLCLALQVQAQGNLPGGFEHVIDVARYSDWGKGYLTITDNHRIGYSVNGEKIFRPLTLTFEEIEGLVWDGKLVVEVDGESAKGWSASQFYSKVDNRQDTITLKLRDVELGDEIVKIRPVYQLPDEFKPFADAFSKVTGSSDHEKTESHYKNNKQGIVYNGRSDSDFDFFTCKTYDYLITSDDPLLDKSIFKKLFLPGSLKRDEKNPDIIFTMARDADESISTTYVPPTSRTVNMGSKTTTRYNYLLERNEYITTQKNRTITEGGYTHETKTADLFLEIAALDAKRVNDPKMTHAPIVWQATTKRHVVNPNFDYDEELGHYASWYCFPPLDREVEASKNIYARLGVTHDSNDPKIIAAVEPHSRAEKNGLRPGDKLLKVDSEDGRFKNYDVKKNVKKLGWRGLVEPYPCDEITIKLEIQRGKEKIKLMLEPLSLDVVRFYWAGGE